MENPSYYRSTPLVLTDEMCRQIAGAVAEIDLAQVAIMKKLTPAERVRQALSLIAVAQQVSAYRLRQRDPQLTESEALRIVRGGGIIEYERCLRERQEPWL